MDISYDGILRCFEEGNDLLGEYSVTMVSVHDPDDFVEEAESEEERRNRMSSVMEAYNCLNDLKSQGRVESIGIGVKNPVIIEQLLIQGVHFDWTMMAGVLTPYSHSIFVRTLLKTMNVRSIQVINAAVFNSGFLVGEAFFNYVLQDQLRNPELFEWRINFFEVCEQHHLQPDHVCVQFSFLFSEVTSVALNACSLQHVGANYRNVYESIPRDHGVWKDLALRQLIDINTL